MTTYISVFIKTCDVKYICNYSNTYLLSNLSFHSWFVMSPLVLNINYLVEQTPWLNSFSKLPWVVVGYLTKGYYLLFLSTESKLFSGVHEAQSMVLGLSSLQSSYSIGIGLAIGMCCISCPWDLCGIMPEWRWERIGKSSYHLTRYIRKRFAFPVIVELEKMWCLKWWQPSCHPEEKSWRPELWEWLSR